MVKDRYYVQRLAREVFLVRQHISQERTSGPDDRVIRAFDFLQDADNYARMLNATQRSLDERFGAWVQDAVEYRSQI